MKSIRRVQRYLKLVLVILLTFLSNQSFTVSTSTLLKFKTLMNSSFLYNAALNRTKNQEKPAQLYIQNRSRKQQQNMQVIANSEEREPYVLRTTSWSSEIPMANTTASAWYLSLPQRTFERQFVSSSTITSVILLHLTNLQPLLSKESIHGWKIFSLMVPRHQTTLKSFCMHFQD